jgi:hypothetical protein
LVDKTGFSRRQVIRSVKHLREFGYIELFAKGTRGVGRRGRDGDKGRGGNRYHLNLSLGCKKKTTVNLEAKRGATDVTLNVEICSVTDVTSNQKRGDTGVTHSYLQDGLTRDRPTVGMYPKGEGTRGAASRPPPGAGAPGATPRDPGFDEFWAAYPRKFQRPKAKAAFARIAPDAETHVQMVTAAQKLAAHIQANGGDISMCPYPENWLQGDTLAGRSRGRVRRAEGRAQAEGQAPGRRLPQAPRAAGAPRGQGAGEAQ